MSTQLIKPNYLVILPPTQHHSFFRNLPPLFFCFHCVPQCLSVLYTHSALVPTFHRRCYWMLQVFHTCSVILFVMIIFNTFYSTLLYSTVLFTTLRYPLLYCNLPYPSLHYPTLPYFTLLYYTCTLPYHNPTLTPPPPDPP